LVQSKSDNIRNQNFSHHQKLIKDIFYYIKNTSRQF